MGKANPIDEISFRLAIDAGRIGTWKRDLSSNLIFQSPITSQILGHGEGETVIPFDSVFTFTHPDDLVKFSGELDPGILSGEPFDMEFRIWRPDRSLRWIAVRGKSINDETGKPAQLVGVMFDITDKKQAAERFRLLTEYSPDAILVESRHRLVYANPVACRLLGLETCDDLSEYSLLDFTSHECYDTIVANYRRINETTPASDLCDLKLKRRDGTLLDVQAVFGFLHWDGVPATQVMLRDVTALKASQRQIQRLSDRLAMIIEGTGDGIWEWDIGSDRFRFSGGFSKIIGRDAPSEASASEWWRWVHPDDLHRVQLSLQECVEARLPLHGIEFRLRSTNNAWKWVRARGVIVETDAAGGPLLMAGTLTDITVLKESDELVWKHAHLDPLTSLPNRRLFRQSLAFDLQKSKHADLGLALLFIDVDGFRYVNDLYGHEAGDLLLMETARRIRACVPQSATVARIGGDEFVVTLPELARIEHVELVCEDLLATLSQRFSLGENTTYISASIGISWFPFDAGDADELLRKAEQAKVEAKRTGKNRFAYFRRDLDEQAHTRLRILSDLRVALALDQFEVHYQPIVDMRDRRIVKAEALLRWNHPVLGSVPPSQFIPMAEEFGLIAAIGEWMCSQAIVFCKQCVSRFGDRFQVGINMSPMQFMTDGESAEFAKYLAETGLPGDRVVIEITEGVLLNKSDKVLRRFEACRRAGIEIALDDFGTGYSSMSYLLKFDIDYIKIDKAFVQSINPSQDSRAIAETIIAMAHRLNKKVIAEGIETQEQWDYLAKAGCDFAQGYLFSPALPPDRFAELTSG